MGSLLSRVIDSQKFLLELKNPFSLCRVTCLHPQTGRLLSGGEKYIYYQYADSNVLLYCFFVSFLFSIIHMYATY